MKKTVTVLSAALIAFSAMSISAFAAEEESAKINITISDDKGQFVVTQEELSVTDADKDGKLTIEDAFILIHDAKFEGGAEKGFAYTDSNGSKFISKLWGIENGGSYGYYLNDTMSNGLNDEVKEGDRLNAFVYQDAASYSDSYSFFDVTKAEAKIEDEIALTLSHVAFDKDWKPFNEAVEDAVITIDGKDTEFKTDAEGKAVIKLAEAGKHVISAKSDKTILVPAVCSVEVAGAEETTTAEPETTTTTAEETTTTTTTATTTTTTKAAATTTKSGDTSPKTGDAGVGAAVAAIAAAFGVAFAVRRKNED